MRFNVGDIVMANGLVDGKEIEGTGRVVESRDHGGNHAFYLVQWEKREDFMYEEFIVVGGEEIRYGRCWGGYGYALRHAECENE